MPVRVVTDSTCDLPPALLRRYAITVVPLTVTFGDDQFLDGVDIDAKAFYERLRTFPGMPRTSQPSVERFAQAYRAAAADGAQLLSIHISSRMSGTLNAAGLARDAVAGEVTVVLVDSLQVSLGLGAVVLAAAEAACSGASLEEAAQVARDVVRRVQVIALVDTLEYLRRGGRIGRAASLLGSLLSIKPIVHVHDGEVAPFERVRTRQRAVERLFELATADATVERMFVGCGGNDAEARAFMERLRPHLPHTELILGQLGPAVGVHSGPNVLGFCPVAKGPA